jgi:hypothetical protein
MLEKIEHKQLFIRAFFIALIRYGACLCIIHSTLFIRMITQMGCKIGIENSGKREKRGNKKERRSGVRPGKVNACTFGVLPATMAGWFISMRLSGSRATIYR